MKKYEDDVEKREDIKWGLKHTYITPEEAIDALRMIGYSESRAIALVDKWAPDKYEPHAVWSKIKPRKLVREGQGQYSLRKELEEELIAHGMDPGEARDLVPWIISTVRATSSTSSAPEPPGNRLRRGLPNPEEIK